ncbi:phosphoribosylanthranilate isomerase [Blattabacterium cuenoti]|uniref:phosphoribosylanthranilate isomerase n=1 Tax=Blattabacterium cuenoti TaxID=1653831 RepID=UPI00163CDEA8|nr:phosphoribosylanthranilate isomerase [Blattabacterium cuenoti]
MEKKLLKIKICGMKFHIQKISDLYPDFMGFIFYPKSLRFVGYNFSIPKNIIDKKILRVGVFVNESEENVLRISKNNELDFIQLHGTENSVYCKQLFKKKLRIIKSFRIDNFFSFKNTIDYIPFCTYFLFDSNTINYGGSGKKFCWKKLEEYNFKTPFFLSGGIGINDFEKIKKFLHPKIFGIDLNSKFEIFPGRKDNFLLNKFIKKIRES